LSSVSATGLFDSVRRRFASDRLLRNVGWFSLAEAANRVSRLLTIVVLARTLDSAEIGLAALALTCFELVRVIANIGVGPVVIRARSEDLAATCAGAWRASWIVCLSTAALQVLAGAALSHAFGRIDLFWMTLVLSGVYLVMPFSQVQSSLIARDNRMGWIAGVLTIQVAADNILCAALALAGFGAWSIVLPKLLVAPIWVLGIRRAQAWTRDRSVVPAASLRLIALASPAIGSEILAAVRLNADKVLVSAILGVEALGIYYFAFNAGIGLSLAITTALAASSYPHFAELAHRRTDLLARFDSALKGAGAQVGLLIALQAALIPFYVPLILGARWDHAVPLAMMLCAGAVTKSAGDLAMQVLRAAGHGSTEFAVSTAITAVCLGTFAAVLPFGLHAGVAALAIAMLSSQFGSAIIARRKLDADCKTTTVAVPGVGASPAVTG
jgi:PST family polysaccharide transporter